MSMKKVVVKLLEVQNEQDKQKALKAVSGISGIQSLGMDMKDQKLTIIGDFDPVVVLAKLRKKWYAEIVSVGAPDAKKEEEAKKNEAKKDDDKKDDEEKKKKKTEAEEIADLVNATRKYYESHPFMPHYCY